MKKVKVIAAIAGLVAPASLMADTTLFGKLNASFASIKDNGASDEDVRMVGSRLGVKGFTPVGDGVDATYIIEAGVDLEDSTVKTDTRQGWFGLRGGFGELRAGRQFGATKVSSAAVDLFTDQYGDYNALLESEFTYNQTITYINRLGPVGFAVELSGDEQFSNTDKTLKVADVVLNYSQDRLYAAVAMLNAKDTLKVSRVSGAYTFFEGHKVGATFEQARPEAGGGYDAMLVSAGYQAGDTFLKAQYGTNKDKAGGKKETLLAVGADYAVGKKTTLMFEYSINKNRDHLAGDERKVAAIGVSHSF